MDHSLGRDERSQQAARGWNLLHPSWVDLKPRQSLAGFSSRSSSTSWITTQILRYLYADRHAKNASVSFIGLILLVATFSSAQSATCYYPDGSAAPFFYTPCNSSAEASACCQESHLCTNEGSCFSGRDVYRGACTDQSWESPQCPQLCRGVNPDGGTGITGCAGDWLMCGSPANGEHCLNASDTFELDPSPPVIFLRPEQTLELGFANGLRISNTTLPAPDITTTQNETITCPSSSATPQLESTGYTAAQMAGVGAGVGVPLLLALVAALVYIAKLRKQHHYAPAGAAWPSREPQGNWEQKRMDAVDQPYEVDGRGRLPELQS